MLSLLYDQPDLAMKLLKYTTDVNISDANNLTPLHIATMKGYFRVVKTLCTKGKNR